MEAYLCKDPGFGELHELKKARSKNEDPICRVKAVNVKRRDAALIDLVQFHDDVFLGGRGDAELRWYMEK